MKTSTVYAILTITLILMILPASMIHGAPVTDVAVASSGTISYSSPPTYSSLAISSTTLGSSCIFSSTWESSVGLSKYIFGSNVTGSWVNQTASSFTSTPETVTYSAILPSAAGRIVGYEWWASDTNGKWTNTGVQSLTTTSALSPGSVSANPNFAFTLAVNTTSYYVLAKNGNVLGSNTDPGTAFELATTKANGSTLYVGSGTYTFSSTFYMDNLVNENITFDTNSLITIVNGLDTDAISMQYDSNCALIGIQINGNSANQAPSSVNGIIEMWDCSNCVIKNANITHCRVYGVGIGDDRNGDAPCGVIDSIITFCGWNGITLSGNTVGNYAINNTVAYCSDVGITNWAGDGDYIIGNYIHDMNGTTGAESPNPSAHYGIAVEDSCGYETIENNTITNCLGTAGVQGVGIQIGTGNAVWDNFVRYNKIINCNNGIACAYSNGDVITQNQITNWGTGPDYGINTYDCTNEIITSNTLTSSSTSTSLGLPCLIESSTTDCSISNNTIIEQLSTSGTGITLASSANFNTIEGNNIQSSTGIKIGSGCTGNRVYQNTLSNCTTQTANQGTGTVTTFSNSAELTLNCPSYYGTISPVAGSYAESTSSQVTITLTPNSAYSAVLNVDGVNVTLTNNAYTLSMNSDHTVYVIFLSPE